MRALFSYGLAFGILLLAAGWLATGTLVQGGQGPGKGERAIISVIEGEEHGPIATALGDAGQDRRHPLNRQSGIRKEIGLVGQAEDICQVQG